MTDKMIARLVEESMSRTVELDEHDLDAVAILKALNDPKNAQSILKAHAEAQTGVTLDNQEGGEMKIGDRVRLTDKKVAEIAPGWQLRYSEARGTILEYGEQFSFVEWDRYASQSWEITAELTLAD